MPTLIAILASVAVLLVILHDAFEVMLVPPRSLDKRQDYIAITPGEEGDSAQIDLAQPGNVGRLVVIQRPVQRLIGWSSIQS
jgi:hypothetical protein